jgi:hypothetical protein
MHSCSNRTSNGSRNNLPRCERMRSSALWLLRRRQSFGDASFHPPRVLLIDACTDIPTSTLFTKQSSESRTGCAWVVALELQELGWDDRVTAVSFDSLVVGGTDSPHTSASVITHVIATCQREGAAFVHDLNHIAITLHVLDAASFIQSILRQWKQSGRVHRFYIARPNPSTNSSTLFDHLSAALNAAALQHCQVHTSDVSSVSAIDAVETSADASKVDAVSLVVTTSFAGTQAAAAAGRDWRLKREGSSNTQPYVSIVLATRVDDHEGNFIERLQNNIDLMAHMVRLYDVSAELLLVEWNPTNSSLMQAISWPTCMTSSNNSSDDKNRISHGRGCISFRIVHVPSHVHATMHRSNIFKLFEFKAKNVGIARARGRFVITGTPDSLWDPSIFSWLGRELALDDRVYRACRISLMLPPPPPSMLYSSTSSRVDALISYMQSSPADPSSRPPPDGTCPVCCEGQGGNTGPRTRLHFGCTCGFGMASGDFVMSSKTMWHRIGGYPEWAVNFHMDSLLNAKFGSVFGGILETTLEGAVYHQWHPRSSKAGWAEPMDWPVPMCDFICCEGGSSSGSNLADSEHSLCQESWTSSDRDLHNGSSHFGCSDGPLTSDIWGLEQLQLSDCEYQNGRLGWICK